MNYTLLEEMAKEPEEIGGITHIYPLHAMEIKHTLRPVEIPTGLALSGPGLYLVLPAPNDWHKGFLIEPHLRSGSEAPLVIVARNVGGRAVRLSQQRPLAQVIPIRLGWDESEPPDDFRAGE